MSVIEKDALDQVKADTERIIEDVAGLKTVVENINKIKPLPENMFYVSHKASTEENNKEITIISVEGKGILLSFGINAASCWGTISVIIDGIEFKGEIHNQNSSSYFSHSLSTVEYSYGIFYSDSNAGNIVLIYPFFHDSNKTGNVQVYAGKLITEDFLNENKNDIFYESNTNGEYGTTSHLTLEKALTFSSSLVVKMRPSAVFSNSDNLSCTVIYGLEE